jgi:hypothetical protein
MQLSGLHLTLFTRMLRNYEAQSVDGMSPVPCNVLSEMMRPLYPATVAIIAQDICNMRFWAFYLG